MINYISKQFENNCEKRFANFRCHTISKCKAFIYYQYLNAVCKSIQIWAVLVFSVPPDKRHPGHRSRYGKYGPRSGYEFLRTACQPIGIENFEKPYNNKISN
jgi:hypothetical protein